MILKFDLMFLWNMEEKEIPISKKMAVYVIEYVTQNILLKKKIIVNSKYYVVIAFNIHKKKKFGPEGVYIPFKSRRTGEGISTFICLPGDQILAAENKNKQYKILELVFEGLKQYFTKNFKSITADFMEEVFSNVDADYINSIPYPLEADDVLLNRELIADQVDFTTYVTDKK